MNTCKSTLIKFIVASFMALVFTIVFSAVEANAQCQCTDYNNTQLSGKVIDAEDYEGVSGATVKAIDINTNNVTAQGTTDSAGNFQLSGLLKCSTYNLNVYHPWYEIVYYTMSVPNAPYGSLGVNTGLAYANTGDIVITYIP